jgi:hypothetical protein
MTGHPGLFQALMLGRAGLHGGEDAVCRDKIP